MITIVRAAFSATRLGALFHARSTHFEAGVIAEGVGASFCASFLTRGTIFVTLVFADMTTDLRLIAYLLTRLVKQSTKTIRTGSFTFMSTFESVFTGFDTALRLTNSALDSTFNLPHFTFLRACETVLINQFCTRFVTWFRADFSAIVTAVQSSKTLLRTLLCARLAAKGLALMSTCQFSVAHFFANWLLRASCNSLVAAWKSSSYIFSGTRLR